MKKTTWKNMSDLGLKSNQTNREVILKKTNSQILKKDCTPDLQENAEARSFLPLFWKLTYFATQAFNASIAVL